jgi:hypothetical protein
VDKDTKRYIVSAVLYESIELDKVGVEDFDPFAHDFSAPVEEIMDDCILSFSKGNAKLSHPYFSLPAGYSCPFAKQCLSKASRHGEEFEDGKKIKDFGQYRCYAASAEVQYKNTRESRWRNFDLLQGNSSDEMADIIINSFKYNIPSGTPVFRIHESGDFFNQAYFDAWIKVANEFPGTIFYAYTKSLGYWVSRLSQIPDNFILNASKGGRFDNLIDKYNLKYVEVVYSPEEAIQKRLKIDIDDSLAWKQNEPFAQLLHGGQSAGSEEGKASRKNREILKKAKKSRGMKESDVRNIVRVVLKEYISKNQLRSVDDFADSLFNPIGVDVEFTTHFVDRLNDPRNGEEIETSELKDLFIKLYQKYGERIPNFRNGTHALVTDLSSNINIPFELKWDKERKMFDMVNNTVLRTKKFHVSPSEPNHMKLRV